MNIFLLMKDTQHIFKGYSLIHLVVRLALESKLGFYIYSCNHTKVKHLISLISLYAVYVYTCVCV